MSGLYLFRTLRSGEDERRGAPHAPREDATPNDHVQQRRNRPAPYVSLTADPAVALYNALYRGSPREPPPLLPVSGQKKGGVSRSWIYNKKR